MIFRYRSVACRRQRRMPHDPPFDQVNHVLGNARGQVGNPLEIPAHGQQPQERADLVRLLPDGGFDFLADGRLHLVDLVVARADRGGLGGVQADQRVDAVAKQKLRLLAHQPQVAGKLRRRIEDQPPHLAGDIHGQVADPLQIVVDLQRGNHEPQVAGHRLVQGERLEALFLDLDLAEIDFLVQPFHLFGQLVVAQLDRPDRLLHLAFDHGAKRQDLLLQFADFPLKMCRHQPRSQGDCRLYLS